MIPAFQECHEGPTAAARIDALVRKVLSVPHDEIVRHEAEYQRQSLVNPRVLFGGVERQHGQYPVDVRRIEMRPVL